MHWPSEIATAVNAAVKYAAEMTPSPHEPFVRAIAAADNLDRLPSLVFADHLDESGHPTWAEIIRRHVAKAEEDAENGHLAAYKHEIPSVDTDAAAMYPLGFYGYSGVSGGNGVRRNNVYSVAAGFTIPHPTRPGDRLNVYHMIHGLPEDEAKRLIVGLRDEGAARADAHIKRLGFDG